MFRKAVTKTSFLLTTCLVVIGLWVGPALGAGPPEADSSPEAPAISGPFAPDNLAVKAETLNAGLDHTCGLKTDGTLSCWGYNEAGKASPPGGTFTQVSAGRYHTCGLRTRYAQTQGGRFR